VQASALVVEEKPPKPASEKLRYSKDYLLKFMEVGRMEGPASAAALRIPPRRDPDWLAGAPTEV
jgi:hypothetical protein